MINKEKLNEVVENLYNVIMEKGYYEYTFALRRDSAEYKVGDIANKSNHWYDFDWDNATELDGTCATIIDVPFFIDEEDEESVNEAKEKIYAAAEMNNAYAGNNWYLLIAELDEYENGEDENEIIIKDAEVLAKIN